MIGKRGPLRNRTQAAPTLSLGSLAQRQPQLLPQSQDPLGIDRLALASQQGGQTTVAITGIAMRQFLQALHNRTGRPGMLTIPAAGPAEVQQHASPTLGELVLDEKPNSQAALWSAYHFFVSSSFMASISRSRSATRRFSREFSFSSSRSRCASETLRPPYF